MSVTPARVSLLKSVLPFFPISYDFINGEAKTEEIFLPIKKS